MSKENQEPSVIKFLSAMNAYGASDLYITIGHPPSIRIEGQLKNLRTGDITPDEIEDIMASILTYKQRREFDNTLELNTGLDMGKFGRYRISVLQQRKKPALVIRRIVSKIPTISDLQLPEMIAKLALEKRGLVIVSGVTGSGKTTTLASMVDFRNMNEPGHIITIEDPIEYYHDHKKCIISQREVGADTDSYEIALKNALRQRPDVILVGEIRDREVMEQTLIAAETGHLCLATLHATNAYQAIERIINLFPEEKQSQVRLSLALNLKAIVSQRLVQGVDGNLVPATEIMLNKGLIRDHIMSGKITQIKDVMKQNAILGMCTFDQALYELYKEGTISEDVATANADVSSDMQIRIRMEKSTSTNPEEKTFSSLGPSKISLED